MRKGDWVRELWESDGVAARAGRVALAPLEVLFAAVSRARGSLYDAGVLSSRPTAIPALAIGNLTVGGTGKTPVAAWFARRLRDAGAAPAVVLRGYGDDEPAVHRTLNPDVEVVVSSDRLAGSIEAKRRGCDVVVLDDAFQHRRAARVVDLVVISADAWRDDGRHLLPAGPWRERLGAVRRASLAVVTRKATSNERAAAVCDAIARTARTPTAIVHLGAGDLVLTGGSSRVALASLRGQSVLAVSAIGDPAAFHAQLEAVGVRVTGAAFRDHHPFTREDVTSLVRQAGDHDRVVCTLKDAVKLAALWPASTPLWYVSQRLDVERGADLLSDVVSRMLAARFASTTSGLPGSPRPAD